MNEMIERLVNDTIGLLEAVAKGDAQRAWELAGRVKRTGWAHAMPALSSAAGAFQTSLENGPTSEVEMSLAVQAIAYEMQDVVREQSDS